MDGMFFDREGNEITSEEWAELKFKSANDHPEIYCVVQEDVGDYWVSTVWTGMNMNFEGGKPLIFETMIFPGARVFDRYATEEEALEGHRRAVDGLERSS